MKRFSPFLALIALSPLLASAQEPAPDDAQTTPQMQRMQAQLEEMQALMKRIQETTDPAERQRLMQAHMQSMHQGMMMMGQMMGPMMGGHMGPRGGGQAGQAGTCPQGNVECRMNQMQAQHGMMAQRMVMMQQMMQQMMDEMTQLQGSPGARGGTTE